jgi:hypothetical protein
LSEAAHEINLCFTGVDVCRLGRAGDTVGMGKFDGRERVVGDGDFEMEKLKAQGL